MQIEAGQQQSLLKVKNDSTCRYMNLEDLSCRSHILFILIFECISIATVGIKDLIYMQ